MKNPDFNLKIQIKHFINKTNKFLILILINFPLHLMEENSK